MDFNFIKSLDILCDVSLRWLHRFPNGLNPECMSQIILPLLKDLTKQVDLEILVFVEWIYSKRMRW